MKRSAVLLRLCLLGLLFVSSIVQAATYLVSSSAITCPARTHTTIAAALTTSGATAGGPHTISICPGTYVESNLSITGTNHTGLTMTSTTGVTSDVVINYGATACASSRLMYVTKGNVTISYLSLRSTNTSCIGIEANAVSGLTLTGLSIAPGNHGVSLTGTSPAPVFTNLTIAVGSGSRDGITLTGSGTTATMSQITVSSAGRYGIYIQDRTSATGGATLRDLNVTSSNFGVYLDNTLKPVIGVSTFTTNTVVSANDGIRMVNGVGAFKISDTTITAGTDDTSDNAIQATGGSNASGAWEIKRVTINASQGRAIRVEGGTSPILQDLVVTSSSGAIELTDTLNPQFSVSTLSKNTITSARTGIYLADDSGAFVIRNTEITAGNGSSSYYGIRVDNLQASFEISASKILRAGGSGIFLDSEDGASSGNIFNNVISGVGTYALELMADSETVGTRVYGNCFFATPGSKDAYNNDDAAVYYNGTSGNYWGSSTGATGFSETCADANSNGICDAIYNVPGGESALDRYALKTKPAICSSSSLHHLQIADSTAGAGLTCTASTLTITACADAACTTLYTGGVTGTLTASSGAPNWGGGAATFSITAGSSSTTKTLQFPAATTATIGISATSPTPTSSAACTFASCSYTASDTGFIFSNAVNGSSYTIPAQIAGSSSVTLYLRAVKTGLTTKACEGAIAGATTVDFAYECVGNPSTCSGSNLMSVNGGSNTTITRNNSASVSSYQAVNVTFDANGNAPFTFNYGDVGQVALWVRKSPSGSLVSTLSGTSNSMAVKPYDFSLAGSTTLCSGTANPAAADAAGAKFCPAGNPFSLIVIARTATGATTPSFGRCDSAGGTACSAASESVALAKTLVAPASGSSGTLGGTATANASAFVAGSGAYTFSNLTWSEVGIISLKASNANYLSNNLAACVTSTPGEVCRGTFGDTGNVGRFYPHHFDISLSPPPNCTGFIYGGHGSPVPASLILGQAFSVTATAKNAAAAATTNYTSALGFSKSVDLTLAAGGGVGKLYVDSTQGGSNAIPASKFGAGGVGTVNYNDASGKISYVFDASPTIYTPLTLHADNADSSTSANTGDASIQARFGRLRLSNAFGSAKTNLDVPVQAQYWSGNTWVLNDADSCTTLAGTFYLTTALTTSGGNISNGKGTLTLTAPVSGNTLSVDIAANLGASGSDNSCLATHGGTASNQSWLRAQNGSCLPANSNRDPSARATFGIYTPGTRRTIHVREQF